MSARRTTIAGYVAVWLFLFAASPAIAPLAALDFSRSIHPLGTDASVADDTWLNLGVLSESSLPGDLASTVFPLCAGESAGRSFDSTSPADRQRARHSILRL
jgi:hypothetical protein